MKVKMRVNVRRWEMHRDGEGIAVVPSCTSKYFLLGFLLGYDLPCLAQGRCTAAEATPYSRPYTCWKLNNGSRETELTVPGRPMDGDSNWFPIIEASCARSMMGVSCVVWCCVLCVVLCGVVCYVVLSCCCCVVLCCIVVLCVVVLCCCVAFPIGFVPLPLQTSPSLL